MNVFYILFMDTLAQTMFYSSITFFSLVILSTVTQFRKYSPLRYIQAGIHLLTLLVYFWNILLVLLFFILNIF